MSFLSEIFGQKTHDNIKILSSEEFRDRVSGRNVQLVDVRTPQEFHERHLENAININYNSSTFETEFNKLDKTKPLYIYCRSGVRSRHATYKLAHLGFSEIYDLRGGIIRWNY